MGPQSKGWKASIMISRQSQSVLCGHFQGLRVIKGLFKGLVSLVVLALALASAAYFWVQGPMQIRGPAASPVDVSIEPGTSAKAIAQAVVDAGVDTSPTLLFAWFRLSGQSRQMRAGSYEIPPGTSPKRCLLYTSPSPRDGLLSRMPSSA